MKKFIRKYVPDPATLQKHQSLRFFSRWLQDGNLWHLNRRSARGAFAAGLFAALMPMPGQTFLAAALAIGLRVNVPIAIALCWVTNPLTMAPIFYLCYNIGCWVLGMPAGQVDFQMSFDWLLESLDLIGKPFLVGSLVFASFCAGTSYLLVDRIWIWAVRRSWRKRQFRTPRG